MPPARTKDPRINCKLASTPFADPVNCNWDVVFEALDFAGIDDTEVYVADVIAGTDVVPFDADAVITGIVVGDTGAMAVDVEAITVDVEANIVDVDSSGFGVYSTVERENAVDVGGVLEVQGA
jgi:hypothetical protein